MPGLTDRASWFADARRLESLGFDVLTVMDHFGPSGGIWGALVAAHEAAPSLRIGTLVLNGDIINPVVVARESVTVDILTEGRLELGIGGGWLEDDYLATGIRRDPPSVRMARLAESLEIIGQVFDGRAAHHESKYFAIRAKEPMPRPIQQRIPILVGGGSRRILELGGRFADTVSVHRNLERGVAASWAHETKDHGPYPDAVAQRIDWVRTAAGERFADIELHALILKVVVTDDRDRGWQDLAQRQGLPMDYLRSSPHFLVGTVEQICDLLAERRARWGISYWTLAPGNDWDAFAPVAQRLSGD
jgi:probable F420-dependent oxidoreductase